MIDRMCARDETPASTPTVSHSPSPVKPSVEADLAAGEFSAWLRKMRYALRAEEATDVDCEGCDACCSSSLFIHIRSDEVRTLRRGDVFFIGYNEALYNLITS